MNLWDIGYYIEAIYRSALPLGSSKNLAWVPSYDVIRSTFGRLFPKGLKKPRAIELALIAEAPPFFASKASLWAERS